MSVGCGFTKHVIHIRNRRNDPSTEINIEGCGSLKHEIHSRYAIDYPFTYVGIEIFFGDENIFHIGHL